MKISQILTLMAYSLSDFSHEIVVSQFWGDLKIASFVVSWHLNETQKWNMGFTHVSDKNGYCMEETLLLNFIGAKFLFIKLICNFPTRPGSKILSSLQIIVNCKYDVSGDNRWYFYLIFTRSLSSYKDVRDGWRTDFGPPPFT